MVLSQNEVLCTLKVIINRILQKQEDVQNFVLNEHSSLNQYMEFNLGFLLFSTFVSNNCYCLSFRSTKYMICMYCERITIKLVNTIISHNCHFGVWWEHSRCTLLVTFKYIVLLTIPLCYALQPQNLFIVYLEVCTL